MKLNQRTAKFLFTPTVVLFMSGTMSFVLIAINQGIYANFISKWLTGFSISFVIALPIAMFAIPFIQKFYERIAEKPDAATAKNL